MRICATRRTACAPTRIRSRPSSSATRRRPCTASSAIPGWRKPCALIQKQGRDAFYRGDIAAAIVAKVQANGGVMTRGRSRGIRVRNGSSRSRPTTTATTCIELPPPGQGFAALEMLNILEVCVPKLGINLATLGPSDPDVLAPDGRGEEARLLGSPGSQRRPASSRRCRSTSSCRNPTPRRSAAKSIRTSPRSQASPAAPTAGRSISPPPIAGATWCRSSTASSASTAAARPSRPTASCSTTAAPPSRSIRKARTSSRRASGRSTRIIAGFVMKDGQPLMTFGNMGGSVQPETHAQHMVNLIDHGMNVQMTTDAARFTHNQNSNVLSLETNLFNLVGAALRAKGHDVRAVTGGRSAAIRASCSRAIRGCRNPSSIDAASPTTFRSTACIARVPTIGKTVRRSAGKYYWLLAPAGRSIEHLASHDGHVDPRVLETIRIHRQQIVRENDHVRQLARLQRALDRLVEVDVGGVDRSDECECR